jgi:hypothetical protein
MQTPFVAATPDLDVVGIRVRSVSPWMSMVAVAVVVAVATVALVVVAAVEQLAASSSLGIGNTRL